LCISERPAEPGSEEVCDNEDCEDGYYNNGNLQRVSVSQSQHSQSRETRDIGRNAPTTTNVLLFLSILFSKAPSLASRAGNNIVLTTTMRTMSGVKPLTQKVSRGLVLEMRSLVRSGGSAHARPARFLGAVSH
jgi:hypothetical protein